MNNQRWTESEFQLAKSMVEADFTFNEIATKLHRTRRAVSQHLNRNGVYWGQHNQKTDLFCLNCGKMLVEFQKLFCSHSCSAKFNNGLRVKQQKFCDFCGKPIISKNNAKYCSNKCFQDARRSGYINRWMAGKESGWVGKARLLSNYVRGYLYGKHGTGCMVCGWDKKHPVDGKSLTEINHIDGNAENCKEDNLEILCPNCHSMTPNFRARNKTSTRNRK